MTRRHLFAVLGLLASAACSAHGPAPVASPSSPASADGSAVDFRAAPPAAGPTPELAAPVAERRKLDNGLVVLVVPKRDLPLVSVTVVAKAGSSADPEGLSGLAGVAGDLLRSGTKTRNAQALADEVETQGAHLEVRVEEDALTVSSLALADRWPSVFDVVADVVMNSTFAADELERVRKRRLAALVEEADDPESVAARTMRETVFGHHPYGHTVLGNEQAVSKISRDDVVAFAKSHLRPANAAVIVVGDVTASQAFAAVEQRLGGWRGASGASPRLPPAAPQPAKVILVPRAEAPQSQLLVGQLGIARDSADYYATLVMNEILGGMFNSRLNMNLREDKGFTYGAYSYFDAHRFAGIFVAGAGVRTDATLPALKEMFTEIAGMRNGDVSDAELVHAKEGFALSLPARFQTIGSIAAMVSNIYLYDFPLDYYRELPKKIRSVTRQDVRRTAVTHLTPELLSIVAVGDPSQIEAGLRAFGRGPIEVRSVAVPTSMTPEAKP